MTVVRVFLATLVLLGPVATLTANLAVAQAVAPASAQTVRVTGVVRDETNAIALPGVPVEVVGTSQVVYTDVDGRYVLEVPPGTHQVKVLLEGYQEKIDQRRGRYRAHGDAGRRPDDDRLRRDGHGDGAGDRRRRRRRPRRSSSSASRRRSSPTTSASQEMKKNGDSDAAAAMSRVTGLSLVDNQYVFVRGLGERYSNTTLAGSVLPTTEPDKKVVPLDLFPTGLIDSVQVSKSYSPDRSAEFAGGLVQIVPMKLPNQPVVDFSYGLSFYSTATGKSIPLSPLGSRDVLGLRRRRARAAGRHPGQQDRAAGHLHAGRRLHRRARSPSSGSCSRTSGGRSTRAASPGRTGARTFGNRFGNLGVVASVTHSYKEQFVEEDRRLLPHRRRRRSSRTRATTTSRPARRRRSSASSATSSYQFTPSQRLIVRELLHAQRPRRRAVLPGAQPRQRPRVPELPAAVHRGRADGERHRRRALLPEPVEQPDRLARQLRARDARRAGPARDALRAGAELGAATRRPFTYADESQSGFRMFNS